MIKQANTKDANRPSLQYVGITFFTFLDRKLHYNWLDANKLRNELSRLEGCCQQVMLERVRSGVRIMCLND